MTLHAQPQGRRTYRVAEISSATAPCHATQDRLLTEGEPLNRAQCFHTGTLARQFAYFGHVSPQWADAAVQTAPVAVLCANHAAVAGYDATVLTADGAVDREQLYFVNWGREGCTLHREAEGFVSATAPGRRLTGRHMLGFNSAFNNYAHWMTDQVPALVAFRDHYLQTGCRLLLPQVGAGHFIDQTLGLLAIPEAAVERIDDEVVLCERLYFLSHIPQHSMPRYAALAARRLADGLAVASHPARRRLFISRNDASARRLLNEAEVLAALEPLGIEVVTPGWMSLDEQIQVFGSAELVIGPHGAGLMNIAFCPPGAAVLELFSEYTVQGLFWQVASHGGLRYGFQVGTSFDQDWGLWSETDNWDAPYVLQPQAVAAAARAALGPSA